MDNEYTDIMRELFCSPKPYWQVVNTSEGLNLIYSKLDYIACETHLENCFNLEAEYDL